MVAEDVEVSQNLLNGWLICQQFAARPAGFTCSPVNPSLVKSYCDAADPYCCNGNDANHHQQYVNIYGQQALAFIKSKLG